MATPPLPASPCLRINLEGNLATTNEWGNRLFFSYSGSAPTAANCVTLATDVSTLWGSHLASLINPSQALELVDVLDIATDAGLSGQWTGDIAGTEGSGVNLPIQCASNIEFNIARRYRGGKPRIYLPPPTSGMQVNEAHWSNTFIGDLNTNFAAFIAGIEALSIGAVGTLAHVNLSFYQGYRTRTTGGGQTTFAPKYRSVALVDTISGYSAKGQISSQKRRRSSTTP